MITITLTSASAPANKTAQSYALGCAKEIKDKTIQELKT
ncbi:hypothetical protein MNB_SM-4-1161 [hydrothermal vent metagenome]|uniref:Uncharacterized protein n=1 Tax=hydrothermal vent metagenome TaxID=652676 RepID=A0A1W1CFB4_9ZZZZ